MSQQDPTPIAAQELDLIVQLIALARAAWRLADGTCDAGDKDEQGHPYKRVDPEDFQALSDALDKLDELPDNPDPMILEEGPAKAERLIQALVRDAHRMRTLQENSMFVVLDHEAALPTPAYGDQGYSAEQMLQERQRNVPAIAPYGKRMWFHITDSEAYPLGKVMDELIDGKACVCGEPSDPGIVHRTDGPCYHQP